MPSPEPNDEFYDLLALLAEDALDASQRQRLNGWLAESAAARRIYRESMYSLAMLEKFGVAELSTGDDAALEMHTETEPGRLPQDATLDRATWRDRFHSLAAGMRGPESFAMVSSALVLMVILSALSVISWNQPSAVVRPDTSHEPTIVGRLHASHQAVWGEDGVPPQPGEILLAGRALELVSGTTEVQFLSGARLILEGPSSFVATQHNGGQMRQGKAVAHVPRRAVGFSILTPRFTAIDLGTEFGVFVPDDDSPADVVVFDGAVELAQTEGNSAPRVLAAGQSARIEAGGAIQIDLESRGRPKFVRSLPEPSAAPPETVTSYEYSIDRQPSALTAFDPAWQGDDLEHWQVGMFRELSYLRNDNDGDDTIRRPNDERFSFRIPPNAMRISLMFGARSPSGFLEIGLGSGETTWIAAGQCFGGLDNYYIVHRGERTWGADAVPEEDAVRVWQLDINPMANNGKGTAELFVSGKRHVVIDDLGLDVAQRPSWPELDCLTVRTNSRYRGPSQFVVEVAAPSQSAAETAESSR